MKVVTGVVLVRKAVLVCDKTMQRDIFERSIRVRRCRQYELKLKREISRESFFFRGVERGIGAGFAIFGTVFQSHACYSKGSPNSSPPSVESEVGISYSIQAFWKVLLSYVPRVPRSLEGL
jgi:hypothetical protein